jgi:hypothetical protein
VAIALATAFSVGVAALQWSTLEKTNTTLLENERAFVFIKSIDITIVGDNIIVIPQWDNSGTTAGNKKINWANWKGFVGQPVSFFYFSDYDSRGRIIDARKNAPVTFIGPQQTSGAEPLNIPLQDIEQAKAGIERIFVWGWIEYYDVFNDRAMHRTEFCDEMIVKDIDMDTVTRKPSKITVIFTAYGPYNTAK